MHTENTKNTDEFERVYVVDITDEEQAEAEKQEEQRIDDKLRLIGITQADVRTIVNSAKKKIKAAKTVEECTEILNEHLKEFEKLLCRSEISLLDNMNWQVVVNQGKPIYVYDNPISHLAYTAYKRFDKELDDSDRRERDRYYRQKKKGMTTLSLDYLPEDEEGQKIEISTEVNFDGCDERLKNYDYLPNTQKEIYRLLYEGYTKTEIAEQLDLTPQKLRTEIKHMAATLTNPPNRELLTLKKTCSVCKEAKPILDFTKDKGKKDGYSCRCKECDRLRKKMRAVGNSTKTA